MQNKIGQKSKIVNALRPENIGLVVVPIQSLGYHEQGADLSVSGEKYKCFITDNYWLVESPMGLETLWGGARQVYIPDSWLRPLVSILAGNEINKEVTA